MKIKSKAFLGPLSHVLFWLLLVSVVYVFRRPEPGDMHVLAPVKSFSFLPLIALFYIHSYLLVPRLLMKKKRALYFLLTLILILLISLLSAFIVYLYATYYGSLPGYIPDRLPFLRLTTARIAACVFFVGAGTGYGALRENDKLEQRRKEKENEDLRTELSFLRSQVNPHFMLNVLNSMVALARKRSDQLEPVLIELAGLMRYMLYDLDNEKVRLEDEIEYLRSYISLQMLRFGTDVKLNFDVQDAEGDHLIEPMLLIPLVENAFKHGIGLFEDPEIVIIIRVPADNQFFMTVRNKFAEEPGTGKDKSGGIGLNNLKKRLNLIYPGKFDLSTLKDGDWFIASLKLQLA